MIAVQPGGSKDDEIFRCRRHGRFTCQRILARITRKTLAPLRSAALTKALADTPVSEPRIPVLSNVDAEPHSDPDTIKAILAKQVVSPVKWEDTMQTLLDRGMESAYEVGPGKVCAGIMKRVSKEFGPVTNVEAL